MSYHKRRKVDIELEKKIEEKLEIKTNTEAALILQFASIVFLILQQEKNGFKKFDDIENMAHWNKINWKDIFSYVEYAQKSYKKMLEISFELEYLEQQKNQNITDLEAREAKAKYVVYPKRLSRLKCLQKY